MLAIEQIARAHNAVVFYEFSVLHSLRKFAKVKEFTVYESSY